jgi:hypothetical protein
MPLGATWLSALARNWWCPRWDPLTESALVSGSTEPTAPASCPMLECAGPWMRPLPANSSTYSSKARISVRWLSMLVSSSEAAASQSSAVAAIWTHGAAGLRSV